MVTEKADELRVLSAVIADDEPMALEYLRLVIGRLGGVEVVAEAADALECVRAVNTHSPDVLFLDIHLPDQNGIEVAKVLSELKDPPHIVFVTGYDEYALPAFEVAAVDYVMKPLTQDRLEKALKRVRSRIQGASNTANGGHEIPVSKLTIKDRDGYKLVAIDDITYIGTQGRKVLIHTESHSYPAHHTLQVLEQKLYGQKFFRVNEGCLVNLDKVKEVIHLGPKSYELLLPGKTDVFVSVSRSRLSSLRELLDF